MIRNVFKKHPSAITWGLLNVVIVASSLGDNNPWRTSALGILSVTCFVIGLVIAHEFEDVVRGYQSRSLMFFYFKVGAYIAMIGMIYALSNWRLVVFCIALSAMGYLLFRSVGLLRKPKKEGNA